MGLLYYSLLIFFFYIHIPELYEGLKRAQRSRLDDQRGTEINFELPDFLKCDQPQVKIVKTYEYVCVYVGVCVSRVGAWVIGMWTWAY